MSRQRELLALKKELLVARASMERLRMAHQLGALHEELRPSRMARGVLGSVRVRATLLALVPLLLGRGRTARWGRRAAFGLAVARTVMSIVGTRAAPAADAPRGGSGRPL